MNQKDGPCIKYLTWISATMDIGNIIKVEDVVMHNFFDQGSNVYLLHE
jgi:hypothetical protein